MKNNKASNFIDKMLNVSKEKSPAILAGCAILGVVVTAWSMYKAAPKAEKIMQEHREKIKELHPNDSKGKEIVTKDTITKIVPVMAPPILMAGATIAAICGSHTISVKRIALAQAAYSVADASIKDLNAKLKDTLGEKKVKELKDSIAGDKVRAEKVPTEKSGDIIITGNGNVLCKDDYSGRYFYSNAEKVEQAILAVTSECSQEMSSTLNDFYALLKIEQIPLGDDLGWVAEDIQHGRLPINKSAVLTEEGTPCLVLTYDSIRPL